MNKYEMLYIIEAELDEEKREAIISRFEGLVKQYEGSVEAIDKWGVKKFAYPIDYKTEGFYCLMTYVAGHTLNKELERVAGITEGVIRHMITKL